MLSCSRDDDGTRIEQAQRNMEKLNLVVSQRRTSRDQWLVLVPVILVNIVYSVTLLEMKMIKVRFQIRSCWHAQVIHTCVLTCVEKKIHPVKTFFSVFWDALKKQLSFVGPFLWAKILIFQGPCTIREELENRKTISQQKLCCKMKSRALGLLKMWQKTYRTKEGSAGGKGN